MEASRSFCWHRAETWCLRYNKLLAVCNWKTIFASCSKGCYYRVWWNWREIKRWNINREKLQSESGIPQVNLWSLYATFKERFYGLVRGWKLLWIPGTDTFLSNNNNLSNNDLDSKSFNEILENDVLNAVHERFQQCMNKLGSDNWTMSAFWMSYKSFKRKRLDSLSDFNQ